MTMASAPRQAEQLPTQLCRPALFHRWHRSEPPRRQRPLRFLARSALSRYNEIARSASGRPAAVLIATRRATCRNTGSTGRCMRCGSQTLRSGSRRSRDTCTRRTVRVDLNEVVSTLPASWGDSLGGLSRGYESLRAKVVGGCAAHHL